MEKMANVEISVIVVAKDITDALPTLLTCFEQQSMPTARYELILVSYGEAQPDAMARIAKCLTGASISVKHYHEPSSSEVKAKNVGARKASGALLLFLDPDLLAGPELLERHVEIHATTGKPVIAFGQSAPHSALPGGLLTRWFVKQDHALMNVEKPESLYTLSSRHCSLSRGLFLEEKGFPEDFEAMRAADILLMRKLIEKRCVPLRLPGIQAFICRASNFDEECARHYREGYDLARLAFLLDDPELLKNFGLQCSSFRYWLAELYMPFYVRTCRSHTLDMRVHGHSCRRVLVYERHRGARAAHHRYGSGRNEVLRWSGKTTVEE